MAKRPRRGISVTAPVQLYSYYRKAARRRNLDFSLSFERFTELIACPCTYCGVPSSNTYQDRKYYPGETFAYNGVDRVDNTRGYFDDNVTVACGRCNRSRSSLSVTEWESYLERIVRFRRTYPNSAYTEAPAMSDTAQVKTIIEATLTGLNTPRRIARWYDVSIALARAEEAKIAEAFRGVFGRMTLAELATAREVVDGAVAYDLAQSTVTAPPAPSIAPPSVTSTKGKKR